MDYIAAYSVELVRDASVNMEDRKVVSSKEAVPALRQFIGNNSPKEHFVTLILDARNRAIGLNLVSVGTLTASLVHPREVYQPALMLSAAAIIICHNHPSGDIMPSQEDKTTTRRLEKAGQILGITLLDHIILGAGENYFSFREQGLLGND